MLCASFWLKNKYEQTILQLAIELQFIETHTHTRMCVQESGQARANSINEYKDITRGKLAWLGLNADLFKEIFFVAIYRLICVNARGRLFAQVE